MSDRTGELEELTEDECWWLLARQTVGRLAVSVNNKPDIFPVNHRVDDDTIVIRTAAGMKLAAAVLATAVAYEVDDIDDMRHTGSSVVIRGHATEIEHLDELLEVADLKVEPWAGGQKDRYLRIVPTHVSGRRISAR